MKNKFVNFIMTIIMILIVVILLGFIVLIYEEVTGEKATGKVEEFVSTYKTLFDDMQDEEQITTPEIIQSNQGLSEIGDTPTTKNPTINNNRNSEKNEYFYTQLNQYSKIIYNALKENKEQMKAGTARIELGTAFSDLLSTEEGEKLLGEYYQSAIESYLYDNPDVFYITANKLYLNIETTTKRNKKTYKVFINSGSQPNYFSDEYSSEEQVNQAINQVEQVKNRILSQRTGIIYRDIQMVHDYLVDNIEYDTTIAKSNIYNIYGALVNQTSVCEGYAKALKYLLDGLNIPCVMVIGKATNSKGETENHAWNYVQIENNWYAIDATWDDPVIVGYGTIGNDIKYRYFLKGRNQMNQDHIPSGQFTEGGQEYMYPNLSLYDFN